MCSIDTGYAHVQVGSMRHSSHLWRGLAFFYQVFSCVNENRCVINCLCVCPCVL